jgi:uncharacterized protein
MKIAGIDYGSKLAGTTAIAAFEPGVLSFKQSNPKQDADRFILEWAAEFKPERAFLDAPLSLPGIYRYPGQYQDYFYRQGDRALRAMSPMFLGGLTARAMQLKDQLERMDIEVLEVYPAHLAKLMSLDALQYKKSLPQIAVIMPILTAQLPGQPQLPPLPSSWHQVDALLALISGIRYLRGAHQAFGHPQEGLIIV